jgi:hypothetical protein
MLRRALHGDPWSVVNASIAQAPLNRPMPEFFSPPNGLFGRSRTGWSLT